MTREVALPSWMVSAEFGSAQDSLNLIAFTERQCAASCFLLEWPCPEAREKGCSQKAYHCKYICFVLWFMNLACKRLAGLAGDSKRM